MKFILNNKTKGFMTIEVLIVAAIITVSTLAAMMVTQKSVSVSRQAFHVTQASFLLEEGAEAVRILRDNAWTNISGLTAGTNYYLKFSGGTWITSSTASDGVIGIFTRTVGMSNVNRDGITKDIATVGTNDVGTKLITVTVLWNEGGTALSKTLLFYIMDIFS